MIEALSVYTNGEDIVIARSVDDARAVLREMYGDESDDMPTDWALWSKPTITVANIDGELGSVTKTPAEWVASDGRGHLCCADY